MPILRFTIRDMFWLVVVVALVTAWWLDNRRKSIAYDSLAAERRAWKERSHVLHSLLRDEFFNIQWTDDAPYVEFQYPSRANRQDSAKMGSLGEPQAKLKDSKTQPRKCRPVATRARPKSRTFQIKVPIGRACGGGPQAVR